MRVLVVGATGGSGRATVDALVARGHEVTAFARRAEAAFGGRAGVRAVDGDVTVAGDVDRAVAGQDAVVVTLGISEHPLRVRLLGAAGTPLDVRSRGTRNVVTAMRTHGVRRLVVQSSYGVGETRRRLPLSTRLVFALLLRPQIADQERQERVVRDSGLDWVIAQPVYLTDGDEGATTSADGTVEQWRVSRRAVGTVLAGEVEGTGRATLAVSGTVRTPTPAGG
ncbi:NAD(P)-dependent oxidoreductase [Geodermatophilus sabuli]|uniref:Nucleoside-diphosphate-sugar epimerase n=1 Tax=Geodermatophilus sabuli TaxID=1564158 RepID=A0A285EI73_9ACTN|nr:NAD(P)-binding oxidoreductase [Geodermatophilus sabuli]MBB3086797.1 nucleoside-diphosphate-sugar epimerase [Geodermatophilus sabuli]SNX98829.1 Nucleoside-diphosphate-sugar epimerase [Geodermatophilus sabuli]